MSREENGVREGKRELRRSKRNKEYIAASEGDSTEVETDTEVYSSESLGETDEGNRTIVEKELSESPESEDSFGDFSTTAQFGFNKKFEEYSKSMANKETDTRDTRSKSGVDSGIGAIPEAGVTGINARERKKDKKRKKVEREIDKSGKIRMKCLKQY